MSATTGWWEWCNDYYHRNDPRTSQFLFISGPIPVLAIVGFYIYFSVSAGPRYMRNKKPYSLRKTLIIYNFCQVLLSLYLSYEGLSVWITEYSWTCEPIDYSESPTAMRVIHAAHLYFLSKIGELLDTVFFVFRKKQRQISFLHVYHHSIMPILTWFGVRYIAGGNPLLLGTFNSCVHVVMYIYYMLAAIGPQMQKYLWWRKYLTLLQITQFIIVGSHSLNTLFSDCDVPKTLSFIIVLECLIFTYLFGSFYITNHTKNNAKIATKAGASTDQSASHKID